MDRNCCTWRLSIFLVWDVLLPTGKSLFKRSHSCEWCTTRIYLNNFPPYPTNLFFYHVVQEVSLIQETLLLTSAGNFFARVFYLWWERKRSDGLSPGSRGKFSRDRIFLREWENAATFFLLLVSSPMLAFHDLRIALLRSGEGSGLSGPSPSPAPMMPRNHSFQTELLAACDFATRKKKFALPFSHFLNWSVWPLKQA